MIVIAPPKLTPVPACVPAEQLPPEEKDRLQRFAALPDGLAEWEQRNCFPRRLDDPALSHTLNPAGSIISIAGSDAVVREPGTAWLVECSAAGLAAAGPDAVTGSDLLTVIDRIATTPELASADIREIGLAKGRRAEGGGLLYALTLGTPRAVIRVQCFEDIPSMVQRAATAMAQARQASVR